MKLCLIIGFCYSDEDTLVSSSIDMFDVYKMFSSRGFSTIVLSDITQHPEAVLNKMDIGKVDNDIYSFLPNLPTGRRPLGGLRWNVVRSVNDLLQTIDSYDFTPVRRLVIYFTGHSEKEGIIAHILLPNSESISSHILSNLILKKCHERTEVLSVFDACYIGNINYPYRLINNRFILEDIDRLIPRTVIHLSSSGSFEISESSVSRSLFTKYLVKCLCGNIINIPVLLDRVQKKIDKRSSGVRKQTVACFSSLDVVPILYSWVLSMGMSISYSNGIVVVEL